MYYQKPSCGMCIYEVIRHQAFLTETQYICPTWYSDRHDFWLTMVEPELSQGGKVQTRNYPLDWCYSSNALQDLWRILRLSRNLSFWGNVETQKIATFLDSLWMEEIVWMIYFHRIWGDHNHRDSLYRQVKEVLNLAKKWRRLILCVKGELIELIFICGP